MILYFDTETTSLSPGQICQLSYVLEGKKISRKNFYFSVDSMDEIASEITGLTKEKLFTLSGGKHFSDHIDEIAYDFGNSNLIVAHNFSFDLSFMQEEFARCQKQFTYNDHFCSMKYFTSILKLPSKSGYGYKYPKLSELASHYKICTDGFNYHDAVADVEILYLTLKSARAENPLISSYFSNFL